MRILIAFRAFFASLFNADKASKIRAILEGRPVAASTVKTIADEKEKPAAQSTNTVRSKEGARSEALTLLTALQRDSRLLDLIHESLDEYNDAQIGGAARNVLRDARKSLDRMFGLKKLIDSDEGAAVELPSSPSPVRWRVVGNVSSSKGTLAHGGWLATRSELPQWTGSKEDALVVAPAEVETRA